MLDYRQKIVIEILPEAWKFRAKLGELNKYDHRQWASFPLSVNQKHPKYIEAENLTQESTELQNELDQLIQKIENLINQK